MQILPTLRRRSPTTVSPWRDFDLLENRMQRMMQALAPWEGTEAFTWTPRVDLTDEDGQFVLTAELPGVEPNDVNVELEGNLLTVRGEKKLEREHKEEHVHVAERHYGSFERTFTLPSGADPDKIEADFHQGVLKLRIAKRPEARGRKIEVKAK
jgi:HSP20 family protein